MPADWMRRQAELVHERCKAADIVITTALIPGRPAPVLDQGRHGQGYEAWLRAAGYGYRTRRQLPADGARPIVTKHGVKIIGIANLPALVAADASALYARNLLSFLGLLLDPKAGTLNLNREDEIIAGSLVCIGGEVVKRP